MIFSSNPIRQMGISLLLIATSIVMLTLLLDPVPEGNPALFIGGVIGGLGGSFVIRSFFEDSW